MKSLSVKSYIGRSLRTRTTNTYYCYFQLKSPDLSPKTPVSFPYLGILYARYGASNHYREYDIYSTEPTLKQIAVIKRPVDGDDWPEIKGFCEKGGWFLIDTDTTKGTPVGSCNACQKWNIETFALIDGELDSVYLGQRDGQDFDLKQWLYTVGYKLMN